MSLREGTAVIRENWRRGRKQDLYAGQRARAWGPTQEGPNCTAELLWSLQNRWDLQSLALCSRLTHPWQLIGECCSHIPIIVSLPLHPHMLKPCCDTKLLLRLKEKFMFSLRARPGDSAWNKGDSSGHSEKCHCRKTRRSWEVPSDL